MTEQEPAAGSGWHKTFSYAIWCLLFTERGITQLHDLQESWNVNQICCWINREQTLAQTSLTPFSLLWTQQLPVELTGSTTACFHRANQHLSSSKCRQCTSDGCERRCGQPANNSDVSLVYLHANVFMMKTTGLPLQHTGEDCGSGWYPVSCWS